MHCLAFLLHLAGVFYLSIYVYLVVTLVVSICHVFNATVYADSAALV